MSTITPHTSSAARTLAAPAVSEALPSSAARRPEAGQARRARPRGEKRRRILTWLTVLAACAAGVAGFTAGGFTYRAHLSWRLPESGSAETETMLRRELYEHAHQTLDGRRFSWSIESDPTAGRLSLIVAAGSRIEARHTAERLSESFAGHLRDLGEQARARPGPDELVLMEQRDELLREAAALTSNVTGSPSADYERLLDGWRDRLREQHELLQRQQQEISQLESEWSSLGVPPTAVEAVVDGRVRAQAVAADVEVQQDLRALQVQLAEGRKLLLDAAEVAAPALRELSAAAEGMEKAANHDDAVPPDGEPDEAVELLQTSSGDYAGLLERFARTWDEELGQLRELDDDPDRAGLIPLQQRLTDELNAFLFQSGPPLGVLRDQVRTLSDDPDSQARRHTLVSALTRAFHLLQTAHHRFEFLAADLKPNQNFRLDAALKSAQGLRRRSRERMGVLETQLAAQALVDLRAERQRRREEVEHRLAELRPRLHESIDAVLALQSQADEWRPQAEALVRASAEQEQASRRVKLIETERALLEARMSALANRRSAALPAELESLGSWVDARPVNLAGKLAQGGFCALLALVVLSSTLLRNPD